MHGMCSIKYTELYEILGHLDYTALDITIQISTSSARLKTLDVNYN